jgi:hypothetical protein
LVTIQIRDTIQNILLLFKIRISTVYSQSRCFQILDYYSTGSFWLAKPNFTAGVH